MDAIKDEFSEYLSQHKQTANETLSGIDTFITLLTEAKAALREAADSPERNQASVTKATLSILAAQTKHKSQQLIELQKQSTALLSKVSKAIDKKFATTDLVWNPKAFEGKKTSLLHAITQHFFREGQFEISQRLHKEAELGDFEMHDNQFHQMYKIIEDLRNHDLSSAIEWTHKHRTQLQVLESSLEFELHKYAYLQLLEKVTHPDPLSGDPVVMVALDYAKRHFKHHPNHFLQIQQLMCALLYLGRTSTPYTLPVSWTEIEGMFSRGFCSVMGLSPESPLFTAVMVGTTALPPIAKMTAIMKEKKNEWSAENELPVDIPLLPMHRFHSVFACPVSREQGSEKNPPMMMPCAHTLCNESLKKLSKNGTIRFKCPYCPSESTASQALRVYL